MNLQSFRNTGAAAVFAAICFLGSAASAQQSTISGNIAPRDFRVAERSNLYCAGYVTSSPVDTSQRIVRAWNEQDGWLHSQFNYVYLTGVDGAKPGDLYSVVRPKGQVKTRWTKKGSLGAYVQEIGSVEVVRVQGNHVIARIQTSCDNFLLGDLVRPFESRVSPMFESRPALDIFGDPSGKAVGRLFMARDTSELLGRDQIVYVDLGAEDNVKVGDYLTVFRPLGKGNMFEKHTAESAPAFAGGYQSDTYQGGSFSNQTGRKSGDNARGMVVTTEKAKDGSAIRKVVGELVVLNVKERTATAVVVRNAQELHPGDWVEVQ